MVLFFQQLTQFFVDLFKDPALPNPLKWAAIGMVLLCVELGHRAWLIVWFALGALSAAVFAQFFPDEVTAQFAVFTIMSVGPMAGFIYHRHQDEKSRPPTPIIPGDRKVRCTEEINGAQSGLIVIDGVSYKARAADPGLRIVPDQWVFVSDFDVDELTAIVTPAHEPAPQVSGQDSWGE